MKRRPCPALWTTLTICRNGDVSVCCVDSQFTLKIGNILTDDLLTIINGPKIQKYRLLHILGNFDRIPTCYQCQNQLGTTVSNDEIISYLKSINRKELIKNFLDRMSP